MKTLHLLQAKGRGLPKPLPRVEHVVADDDSPTLDTEVGTGAAAATSVPTLTIVAHPQTRRLGERAALGQLVLRRKQEVSRTKLGFRANDGSRAPLLDVSVSRSAFELSIAADDSLVLDPAGVPLQVDGLSVSRPLSLTRERLARGVQIRLSSRVGLLLHLQPELPLAAHASRLIGDGVAMRELLLAIEHAAEVRAPVLILGESGAGKELVAEAIHARSVRGSGAWVAVNMATLSDETAYSQLFGHNKGAFTGAAGAHDGLFVRAHGGTLFLDEIADATARVQAMLLRALETSMVLAMGANSERPVDVRVLAATERDVGDAGCFRGALAQRLAGLVVRVPPLRERPEDIPMLLLHFLSTLDPARCDAWLSPTPDRSLAQLPTDFMFKLISHRFPGNVRELRNIAAQLLAHGQLPERWRMQLPESAVGPCAQGADGFGSAPHTEVTPARPALSVEALRRALIESGWSPARAARLLGVANSTVHYWIKRWGIVRRAGDYSAAELQQAAAGCGGDLGEMARTLSVSARGLRLRLKQLRINLRTRSASTTPGS